MPARPAGVESFRKCPMTGCPVNVWGPLLTDNYCRAHGGTPPIETHDDEYGNPVMASEADPPRPRLAPLEA